MRDLIIGPLIFLGTITDLLTMSQIVRYFATRDMAYFRKFNGWGAIFGTIAGTAGLVDGWWAVAGGFWVFAVVCAVIWWSTRRKRRDRARKAAGAKSRALVAALVKRAREVSRPRPVVRPVPQGGVSP